MMNKFIGISLAMLFALPNAARANEIIDASYQLDRESAQIVLRSREALGAPRVRIERGAVRMTFGGISEQQWLAPLVDGEAVRGVAVYPGVNEGAVVRVTLGDKRTLESSAIRITRQGPETRISIARRKLPGVARASEASEPRSPVNAEPATPETKTATVSAKPAETKPPEVVATPKPLFTLPIKNASSQPGAVAASMTGTKSSAIESLKGRDHTPVALMLLASLLLLGVYGAIRLGLGKRGPGTARSNIEVIGSKRLAARHQLVVVRALGEDHLLSINGGHTERLASMPSPKPGEQSERTDEQAAFAGFFSRWQKTSASLLDKVDQREVPAERDPDPFNRLTSSTRVAERDPDPFNRLTGSTRVAERDKDPFNRPTSSTRNAELLHFGDRKGRSPLEAFNLLEAKRINGSDAAFEPARLRDRSVG